MSENTRIDLQAAGGLEPGNCVEVCDAGVTSLPLGAALHREADMRAFVSHLRQQIDDQLKPRVIQTRITPPRAALCRRASNWTGSYAK